MQTIYIDIANKGVMPTINAKQGDVGRKFEICFSDSGVQYQIPNGAAFSAFYSGTSGEGNYTDIGQRSAFTINGNSVIVELIEQMLVNYGDGILCLVLGIPGGASIGTWNIPYQVEIVPGQDSEEATKYYTAFSEAVNNLPYPDATLSAANKAADAASVGAALAQKAPAGYGLGAPAPKNINNLDEVDGAGWYSMWFNAEDMPTGAIYGNWTFYVTHYGGQNYFAIRMPANHNWGDYSVLSELTRWKREGVWQPWEWEHPPMVPGVEYRTTERWNGKPVYAMLVNCGGLPAGGSATVSIPASGTTEDIIFISGSGYGSRYFPSTKIAGGAMSVEFETGVNNIGVYVSQEFLGGLLYFITVKYTLA